MAEETKKTNWTLIAVAGFITGAIGSVAYYFYAKNKTTMPAVAASVASANADVLNDAGGGYTPYIPGMKSVGCGCAECAEKHNATGKHPVLVNNNPIWHLKSCGEDKDGNLVLCVSVMGSDCCPKTPIASSSLMKNATGSITVMPSQASWHCQSNPKAKECNGMVAKNQVYWGS